MNLVVVFKNACLLKFPQFFVNAISLMAQAKLYFLTVCKLLEVWDHCMGYLISAPCILNTRNDSTIVNGEVPVGGNRFNTCIIGKETTINLIGSQSSDELRLMGFTKLRSS